MSNYIDHNGELAYPIDESGILNLENNYLTRYELILEGLTKLNLNQNRLTKFIIPRNLVELDLGYNMISEFNIRRGDAPCLTHLRICNNRLTETNISAENLVFLDLASNQLTHINLFAPKLDRLSLKSNRLDQLDIDASRLSFLDLRNNQIEIPRFNIGRSMKFLYLHGNPIADYHGTKYKIETIAGYEHYRDMCEFQISSATCKSARK